MDWVLKFAVLWLSIDIIIFASSWYAITVIKPRSPDWWRRVIVDIDPEANDILNQSGGAAPRLTLASRRK